ncbi:2-C-methyl-D-erythritol 2 4-cyclodiphosphate synthase [Bacteroides sp. CAG:927]|jgi:ygbB family|nr:2-C-methyl-D-erythritol 2 4-cyclodiphosphate synthase [Bacteroides sp. CAG:927]
MDMIPDIRTGSGFDVHRFAENRRLVICGVEIPYELGLLGHSDADVALHALADALLGAAAMRDIGYHFPDSSADWEGADSRVLLRKVVEMVRGAGFAVGNADVTIIAQAPKMLPYIEQMRANVAEDLGVDVSRVSVKATTTERLGFTGRKEGIASMASVLIYKN